MTERLSSVKSALIMHATKYPKMRPADAVKLVYQACFGGGHLIKDEAAARAYLLKEYENTSQRITAPLCEPIGNGILRVNLAALDSNSVGIDELFEAFLKSAKEKHCDMQDFLQALDILKELTKDNLFRFSTSELDIYISEYAKAGYPMVSHSEEYKAAYEPAYRIVCEKVFKH